MAENDIEKVLLTAEEIRDRVRQLAAEIRGRMGGGEIVAIGVLTGAFVFLADLARELGGDVHILLLRAASYGDGTIPGKVDVETPGKMDLEGRDVLLVEDIVDTGHSLEAVRSVLSALQPRSLLSVVLLDKPERREVDITADFTGFTVPDEFLVGYGLDYAGRYRNLPDIAVLAPSVYQGCD